MYKNWAGLDMFGMPSMDPGEIWQITLANGESILALYTEGEELVNLDNGELVVDYQPEWVFKLVNVQFLVMED